MWHVIIFVAKFTIVYWMCTCKQWGGEIDNFIQILLSISLVRKFLPASTITYQVFHHNLLITKLQHIDYKIILMAYMVKKIGFMASQKSYYLNEWWGWSNNKPPCQKVSSVSPPCHEKVMLLMAEFCDLTSASDKPKLIEVAQNSTLVGI